MAIGHFPVLRYSSERLLHLPTIQPGELSGTAGSAYLKMGELAVAMAQVAKDHHFVPKCYLAGFTDTGTEDGRLCVFDFVADRFFRQRPKNVAFEKHFNRVEIEGHQPDVLEKAFGEFEGNAASAIRRICQDGNLPTDTDLCYVLNLICLLATRNPRVRRSMAIARRKEARIIGELLVANRQTYECQIAESREAGFITGPDIPYEQVKSLVEGDEYRIEIPTDAHLQSELRVFGRVLHSLGSRSWSLLTAKPDAPDFITCDHPANLVPKQIVFPIDARNAVIGVEQNALPNCILLATRGVAEVNTRLCDQADRQVYSRSPEVSLLHEGEVVKISLTQLTHKHA